MLRKAMQQLYKWKENKDRKPLIIRGARQVGKTWLMKEFGRAAYENTVYISFDNNTRMKELFDADLNIERIMIGIELYAGRPVDPETTLLIFDEVQEIPRALSFEEFMTAMGKERFVSLLQAGDYQMVSTFRQEYIDLLKYYYFIGGMPEVVQSFAVDKDFNRARELQQRILESYEQDFSKHAPNEVVPRIRMLWNSIPAQLTKENKKFIYGLIKEGARAKEYELALLWLEDCGLVHKVHRVTAPNLPLKAYEDLKAFKLFMGDVGLLSCMVGLRQEVLLDGSRLFKEFKGALTEQYVLQQFKTMEHIKPYYWINNKGTAEIDFLIDNGIDVIPVEVKAEVNLQAKSLKAYRDKFKPAVSVRTSMADFKVEDWLINLPLYAISQIDQI